MALIQIGGKSLSASDIKDLLYTDHPMVEEFRFEKTYENPGSSINFSLKIIPKKNVRYLQIRDSMGYRIKPQWKTLTGNERIGQGNRVIMLHGNELVAENSTFFPNQEFNDLGIGSSLYVSMERLYRELGINRVTLLAVAVGVYVWARQGFAFDEPGMPGRLIQPFTNFINKNGYKKRDEKLNLNNSWDFANFDIPGVMLDDYRVGKYYMLNRMSGWSGSNFSMMILITA